MDNPNKNRIQLYLKEIHRYIIDQVRKENEWDESVPDREIILYIMIEFDKLKQKEKKEQKRLEYIDQHTTMLLDLTASICTEMNVPQRPLEDCLSYFEAKEYMESLLNNRRAIRPSQSVQHLLQTPKAMRPTNDTSLNKQEASIEQPFDASFPDSYSSQEAESMRLSEALGQLRNNNTFND